MYAAPIYRRRDVGRASLFEIMSGNLERRRGRREAELSPVRCRERVGQWIERKSAGKRYCRGDLRAHDKIHGRGLPIIATRKIAVVGRDDRIRLSVGWGRTFPLADLRIAVLACIVRREDSAVAIRVRLCDASSVSFSIQTESPPGAWSV